MAHLNKQKIIYVDSDYRSSGDHSDFRYDIADLNEYDYVSVLQVSIPKTFYNVQAGQNTLTLTENIGVAATVTFSVGSYSYKNFATVLAAKLTAASPNGRTYTVTIPTTEPVTGKYTITVSTGSFTISFPSSSYMYKHLGFESLSSNASTGTVLTSVNVASFQDVPSLYICSDLISTHIQTFNSTVLEAVFCGPVVDFGILTWNNMAPELTAKEIRNKTSTVRFYLMDVDQNLISTNGVAWNMVLGLYTVNRGLETMENYFKLLSIQEAIKAESLKDGSSVEKKS